MQCKTLLLPVIVAVLHNFRYIFIILLFIIKTAFAKLSNFVLKSSMWSFLHRKLLAVAVYSWQNWTIDKNFIIAGRHLPSPLSAGQRSPSLAQVDGWSHRDLRPLPRHRGPPQQRRGGLHPLCLSWHRQQQRVRLYQVWRSSHIDINLLFKWLLFHIGHIKIM